MPRALASPAPRAAWTAKRFDRTLRAELWIITGALALTNLVLRLA